VNEYKRRSDLLQTDLGARGKTENSIDSGTRLVSVAIGKIAEDC
jgi:hypothetical protein